MTDSVALLALNRKQTICTVCISSIGCAFHALAQAQAHAPRLPILQTLIRPSWRRAVFHESLIPLPLPMWASNETSDPPIPLKFALGLTMADDLAEDSECCRCRAVDESEPVSPEHLIPRYYIDVKRWKWSALALLEARLINGRIIKYLVRDPMTLWRIGLITRGFKHARARITCLEGRARHIYFPAGAHPLQDASQAGDPD